MTSDEAGRLQEAWKAKGNTLCQHIRMVDKLDSDDPRESGYLVCKECGSIFPDPLKQIG